MRGIPGTKHISYHKKDDRYTVQKITDGKLKHLGSHNTLIGALMIRDWCEANNWKSYPNNRNKSTGEKYIHYRENIGVYEIVKNINGHNEYFGRYHTLEDAKKWRDYFIDHNWDVNQRLIGTPNKNIYFKNNKYLIIKCINGKDYHFGTYSTMNEAKRRVKEIRKKGWEKTINDNERLISTTVSNIVKLPNGKYEIVKNIDGVRETFGVFEDYESAENEVKLLRKSNWDYEVLCESIDETINGHQEWLTGTNKLKTGWRKYIKRNDAYAFSRGRKNEIKKELQKYSVN